MVSSSRSHDQIYECCVLYRSYGKSAFHDLKWASPIPVCEIVNTTIEIAVIMTHDAKPPLLSLLHARDPSAGSRFGLESVGLEYLAHWRERELGQELAQALLAAVQVGVMPESR